MQLAQLVVGMPEVTASLSASEVLVGLLGQGHRLHQLDEIRSTYVLAQNTVGI